MIRQEKGQDSDWGLAMHKILAIDLGSSALKILVMGEDLSVLHMESVPYETDHPAPGFSEQDPGEWAAALKEGLCGIWEKERPEEIGAVSFSGHMSGVLLLDDTGKPLYPCITLADTRSEKECEWMQKELGDEIQKRTGNPVINAFAGPKLLWLKEHTDCFKKASVWMPPKDYLKFLLTGRMATEYTDAYNSLFLNPVTRDWDYGLIREAGFETGIFPEVLSPYDLCGTVTEHASRIFGLKEGTPVYSGAADMACGAVGMNLSVPGEGVITLGTSATFLLAADKIRPEAAGAVTYHLNVLPDTLYALGSHFNGGLVMNCFSRLFSGEERIDYKFLQREAAAAAEIGPGSGGILTIPFLAGSGSPYFNPYDRGTVLGLHSGSRRSEVMRSAMEGVVYNMYQTLSLFERLEGRELDCIYLAGGGIRIPGWPQIFADVMGRKILTTTAADASAAGAALIGGFGAGIFSDLSSAAAKFRTVDQSFFMDSNAHEQYRGHVKRYLKAYEALAAFYHEGRVE